LERAAAALSRGLSSSHSWEDLIGAARRLTLSPSALDQGSDSGGGAEFSAPHFAAARVLDGAAQYAPQSSPSQSREWGLWAAAAFAQTGNFPSSTVVARRTFVRLRGHDAETATLLGAVAPVLASALRADSPVAAHLCDFLATGAAKEAAATRRAWKKVASGASDKYPRELWELAGRGLEAALKLGALRILREASGQFPTGFETQLAARVPALLPPQAKALRSGFLDGSNALVALAPGSGKTLLGELFLAAALGAADEAGWAVFVVPYVALGRGVAAAVAAHFPDGVQRHQWLGGAREEETDLTSGTHLVVATPERLDAYLRRHPESWTTLRGAVFDEAHLIGEGARGVRMEGLLARLKMRGEANGPLQILLLSAALGDYSALAKWIGARHIICSDWTPTARRLGFWRPGGRLEWHGDWSGQGLQPLGDAHIAPPYPHIRATGSWPRMREMEPLTRENVAHLTHHLFEERGGPILCLCSTRRATREVALALGEKWPLASEVGGYRARAIEAIESRHRTLLPLVDLLKKGVAWHNSSLPLEVRAAIEAGIAQREIAVVTATSTLAEGVDLPFRLTVVADWLKWEEGGQKPLSPALFRNIAGRCGRAGAFTEGDTLVFDNPLGDEQFTARDKRIALQHKLYLGNECGETRSALEALGDSQLRSGLESTFETQLLAALGETEGNFPENFLKSTFLAQHAPERVEEWRERAQLSLQQWKREGLVQPDSRPTLTQRGAAWRATDLSPLTCRRLLGALETLPRSDYSGVGGISRINAHLWRALRAAPEAGGEIERFFGPRSRFVATHADLEAVGALWLRGTSTEAIFAALPRVQRAGYRGLSEWVEGVVEEGDASAMQWSAPYERWLDFVRAGLETWSPWLWRAGGVLAPLAGGAAAKIDWRGGAALWETGVDTTWASKALEAKAPGTRAVVAALGRLWPFEIRDAKHDPLALAWLQSEEGVAQAEAAFAAALKEVGGRYCVAGRNMLELRDWVWGKAGLRK
jgi:helicase